MSIHHQNCFVFRFFVLEGFLLCETSRGVWKNRPLTIVWRTKKNPKTSLLIHYCFSELEWHWYLDSFWKGLGKLLIPRTDSIEPTNNKTLLPGLYSLAPPPWSLRTQAKTNLHRVCAWQHRWCYEQPWHCKMKMRWSYKFIQESLWHKLRELYFERVLRLGLRWRKLNMAKWMELSLRTCKLHICLKTRPLHRYITVYKTRFCIVSLPTF